MGALPRAVVPLRARRAGDNPGPITRHVTEDCPGALTGVLAAAVTARDRGRPTRCSKALVRQLRRIATARAAPAVHRTATSLSGEVFGFRGTSVIVRGRGVRGKAGQAKWAALREPLKTILNSVRFRVTEEGSFMCGVALMPQPKGVVLWHRKYALTACYSGWPRAAGGSVWAGVRYAVAGASVVMWRPRERHAEVGG